MSHAKIGGSRLQKFKKPKRYALSSTNTPAPRNQGDYDANLTLQAPFLNLFFIPRF